MQDLIEEIKQLISANIDLGGADLSKFGPEGKIFGESGLGLDSLDAVELITLLQRKYGITIQNMHEGRAIFHNLGTLAQYIEENRKK